MVKKIKAVDIVPEEPTNPTNEETIENKPEEIETKEEIIIEESIDEPEIVEPKIEEAEIVESIEETDNKSTKKMITCPDCNKTMLEKNFRYRHIHSCGKVRNTKKARPIEEVIQEKREKINQIKETKTQETKTQSEPVIIKEEPPPKPDYWTLRKEYNNRLLERKQQLVQKIVSKAFRFIKKAFNIISNIIYNMKTRSSFLPDFSKMDLFLYA